MQRQEMNPITEVDSELISGGGPGTGEAVQLFQNFSKDLYGVPFPVAYKPFIGSNGWGNFVSGTLSKLD
jgi:hypothetical protein